MKSDDLERKLKALHVASETISANLLELEIDPNRQLLEVSDLDGRSAAVWAPASEALSELWRRHTLLDQLLERADKLRGSRHAGNLRSLLDDASIELARVQVPIAERPLLGPSEASERCSPDQLIAAMSTSFDEVRVVISTFGDAWQTLVPKLGSARQLLEETRTIARSLAESASPDLDPAAAELDRLSARVSRDPLSVSGDELERVLAEIRTVRDDLRASAALRDSIESRIAESRRLLEQVSVSLEEAEAARLALEAKIAAPPVPPSTPPRQNLERGLAEITALAERGAWRAARQALDAWSARANGLLEDARNRQRISRAPLEKRNQLRGMLDAYQVKAGRLGVVEDPELAGIFIRAHDALYTAPTDLALATSLVQRYQLALTASERSQEMRR